jgi:oxaloacetate decarboxylase alpha subunit
LAAEPIHGMALTNSGSVVYAPMAGNILKILVSVGNTVAEGDVVVVMEAMKMETEVRSKFAGIVSAVHIKEGGAVAGGNALISL